MWIKDVIDKIRKGVKAGMIAVKESNALTDARVVRLISEFEASSEREWMMTGERYYQVDNDILSRKITHKDSRGNVIEESYKATENIRIRWMKKLHICCRNRSLSKWTRQIMTAGISKDSKIYWERISNISFHRWDMKHQIRESPGCMCTLTGMDS